MSMVSFAVTYMPKSWIDFGTRLRWKSPLADRLIRRVARTFRNRDNVIGRGFGQGLRFNTGDSHVGYVFGTTETDVQVALKSLVQPGMIIYDIGANVGFHAVCIARAVGKEGKVFCFEALPDNARKLEHNVALNGFTNIEVIVTALGNSDGEASFWLSEEPTWGKLVSVGTEPGRQSGQVNVKIRRLDGLIEEYNLPPPQLIKIDVEGAEIDVFEGARQTLKRYRPILVIEAHGTNSAIEKFLIEAGYRVGVIGNHQSVADSYWNAHLFAVPAESASAAETFTFLQQIHA